MGKPDIPPPSVVSSTTGSPNRRDRSRRKKKPDSRLDDDPNLGRCQDTMFNYRGLSNAKALAAIFFAFRGLNFSNILYTSALLYLLSESVDCVEDGDLVEECEGRILGVKPAQLIFYSTVSIEMITVSLLPLVGLAIDRSDRRRRFFLQFGLVLVFMFSLEAAATNNQTLPLFMLLHASMETFSRLCSTCTYAYLSELREEAKNRLVVKCTCTFLCSSHPLVAANFLVLGSISQLSFAIVAVALSIILGLGTVALGRVARVLSLLWFGLPVYLAYRWLPDRPVQSSAILPSTRIQQVKDTIQMINNQYSKGLKWFFLATIFTNAAIDNIVVLAPIFFTDFFGLDAKQSAAILLGVTLTLLLGAKFSVYFTKKTDPIVCWMFSIALTTIGLLFGMFTLQKRHTPLGFVLLWTGCLGFPMGRYYGGKVACYALMIPKGQPAELGGIYVFCERILSWAPLVMFNLLLQANVAHNWALSTLCVFNGVGIVLIRRAAPWRDIKKEVNGIDAREGPLDDLEAVASRASSY